MSSPLVEFFQENGGELLSQTLEITDNPSSHIFNNFYPNYVAIGNKAQLSGNKAQYQ